MEQLVIGQTERTDILPSGAHIPVMLNEVLEGMAIPGKKIVVDATLGMAGHSKCILKSLMPEGCLIGIDRDAQSLESAKTQLQEFDGKFRLVHDDFRNLDQVLHSLGIQGVDGILMDLGISSFQLNNGLRGFSFREDGPLDMRMDQSSYISAYDLVNSLSEKELSSIIKNFGEERWHHRIARGIVLQRNRQLITTTTQLAEVILKSVPGSHGHQRIHPATRTFQALRIAVNRELESLEIVLGKAVGLLNRGGRLCIISFHSLEDRIVKHTLRRFSQEGKVSVITKKPLRPTEQEENENPRARSARLRIAERT